MFIRGARPKEVLANPIASAVVVDTEQAEVVFEDALSELLYLLVLLRHNFLLQPRCDLHELVVHVRVLSDFANQGAVVVGFLISDSSLALGSFPHKFLLLWLQCDLVDPMRARESLTIGAAGGRRGRENTCILRLEVSVAGADLLLGTTVEFVYVDATGNVVLFGGCSRLVPPVFVVLRLRIHVCGGFAGDCGYR